MTKIIDGHFHVHLNSRKAPINDIYDGLERHAEIVEEYNIEKALGVINPKHRTHVQQILVNNPYIYPGLLVYTDEYDKDPEMLENINGLFEFVKIHNWICGTLNLIDDYPVIFDKSIENGIKKFQLHTDVIPDGLLNVLEKYVKQHNAMIYLVHGANVIDEPHSAEDVVPRLKKLKGNVFLGTSSFHGSMSIPNDKIIAAVEVGLEDMVVFESDFVLDGRNDHYLAAIASISEGVGKSDKIFYKNIQPFLE